VGVTSILGRLAAKSTPSVFVAAGMGAAEVVAQLEASGEIHRVASPAAATVLLVVGGIPPALESSVAAVHDGMPHPRGTVHLPLGFDHRSLPTSPHALVAGSAEDAVVVIRDVFAVLMSGRRASDPAILGDVDPNPWRGVGPYGQGGSGMTGGTPYGRPLAELGADRDGLRLDVLPHRIGPLFAPLGAGVTLDATMAGDVIVVAQLADSPFAPPKAEGSPTIFQRALNMQVPIAEVEIARARDHLRWVASSLAVMGIPALGMRTLRLAAEPLPDASRVAALARRLRVLRIPSLPWAGRGPLASDAVHGLALGPVSRASGEIDDARADEPAYRRLGFEPLIGTAGDAAERWTLRLREAAASLDLARRAGATEAWGSGVVECPRGRLTPTSAPFGRIRALVPSLLEGLEWGDAVVSLVSLDIDASAVPAVAASEAAA
jgi:hypothetical protein